MKLVATKKRIRGKDVFLDVHALERMKIRNIDVDMVIRIIRRPSEFFREMRYKPILPNMKRYVAVMIEDMIVYLVVYGENENIIVITSWGMKPVERYVKYRDRKVEKGDWIRLK